MATGLAGAGLAGAALAVAVREIGAREEPLGSNRGARVEQYLASVGLPGGYSWCMAFVHWCFAEAARSGRRDNPFPSTGGCAEAWHRVAATSPACTVAIAAARARPALVRPGLVFVLDLGGGAGHTGFVESLAGDRFTTVEGNTGTGGGRNGVGVYRLTRRRLGDTALKGFLDFTAA